MQHQYFDNFTVLAIDPYRRGFGFAVLEARGLLTWWGVAELFSTNDAEFLIRLDNMIERGKPDVLCLQDIAATRRSDTQKRRVLKAAEHAKGRNLDVLIVSAADIRAACSLPPHATKYEVANRVFEFFPAELDPLPRRMPWQSASRQMNVYDAAAIACTALALQNSASTSHSCL